MKMADIKSSSSSTSVSLKTVSYITISTQKYDCGDADLEMLLN
jgi:hypothetical protein